MKIALIIERYDAQGGGAERWTDRHARYLLSNGVQVHLVAERFRGSPPGAICHAVHGGRGWGSRLRFAERVERLCIRQGFDVVHDMGCGWHADIFHPHHGTRIAGLEQNLEFLSPLARLGQRWAYRWTPRYREFQELERRQYAATTGKTFVAVSKMVQSDMRRLYGVPEAQTCVVYNGVDIRQFHPERNPTLRKDLGWENRTIYLLVAHNFRLKGLPELIHATARLRSMRSDFGLLVLGGGRTGPYRRLARHLDCGDCVRFMGNQTDVVRYYHAADVYVHPTYYDPCSLVVLEALACGLPVVTTERNGAAELISPGQEGEVIPNPKDVGSLAWGMSRFLKMGTRERAGQSARRLAERHSLEANSAVFLDLYRRHANPSSGRRKTA